MPIYEYNCEACGKKLEVLVRGGKAPEVCGDYCESEEHPQAGEGKLKKLISKAGIIFKGSGFHKNDYSSNGGGGSSTDSSSSSDSSSSDSSSSGSTEKAGAASDSSSSSSSSDSGSSD